MILLSIGFDGADGKHNAGTGGRGLLSAADGTHPNADGHKLSAHVLANLGYSPCHLRYRLAGFIDGGRAPTPFRRGSCPPGHAPAGMRRISLANLRSVTWRGTALLALGHLGAALPGAAAPAPAHAASRAFALAPRSAREFAARSVDGRALRAIHIGPSRGPAILVVGAIHGNEPAGIAVARDLLADSHRVRASLWVISDLNPDGVARGTRQNAHGVDLNRNFPWRWHLAGRVGDFQYSGPTVLSEPESRFAFALIRRVHPAITIWFHQPLGVVDASGGSLRVERRFANRVGLPLQELSRYRGSAATWQNHYFHTSTAFVVELPAGALTDAKVEQFAHAVETAAG